MLPAACLVRDATARQAKSPRDADQLSVALRAVRLKPDPTEKIVNASPVGSAFRRTDVHDERSSDALRFLMSIPSCWHFLYRWLRSRPRARAVSATRWPCAA